MSENCQNCGAAMVETGAPVWEIYCETPECAERDRNRFWADAKDARIAELEGHASLWRAEYEAARDCYDAQDIEIANLKGLLREANDLARAGYSYNDAPWVNLRSRIDSALKGEAK